MTPASDRALSIALLGGIFGAAHDERTNTPETILAAGLRARGHEVVTWGLGSRPPAGDYDIVHAHHLAKQSLAQALRPSAKTLVFTRHGVADLPPSQKLALRVVARRADAVVALSPWEATMIRSSLRPRRIEVIPNGIDPMTWAPPLAPRTAPTGTDPWIVEFVGQLVPIKQVDVLIAALPLIRASRPIRLRLITHNPMFLEPLLDQARTLGVHDQIDVLGPLDATAIAELHRSAHVLVLPSMFEALPSVITEAMYSELPVVASAVGGIPWQGGDLITTVPPGDAAALAAAIQEVIDDYDGARTRAAAARQRALQTFEVDAMIESHLALYRSLVE